MQKIPLNRAKPGMKLAKPVARDNGTVIMAEGMELTESLLTRLENMKIDKIVVQGQPVDMDHGGADTGFSKRLERLDHLFRHHESDPWMRKIKKFLTRYFQVKIAEQNPEPEEEEEETSEHGEQES
jgi:hypothetical protein